MYYNLNEQKFKHIEETYVEVFNDVTPSFGYQESGFPSIARKILIQAKQEYVDKTKGVDASSKTTTFAIMYITVTNLFCFE